MVAWCWTPLYQWRQRKKTLVNSVLYCLQAAVFLVLVGVSHEKLHCYNRVEKPLNVPTIGHGNKWSLLWGHLIFVWIKIMLNLLLKGALKKNTIYFHMSRKKKVYRGKKTKPILTTGGYEWRHVGDSTQFLQLFWFKEKKKQTSKALFQQWT